MAVPRTISRIRAIGRTQTCGSRGVAPAPSPFEASLFAAAPAVLRTVLVIHPVKGTGPTF